MIVRDGWLMRECVIFFDVWGVGSVCGMYPVCTVDTCKRRLVILFGTIFYNYDILPRNQIGQYTGYSIISHALTQYL